MSASPAATVNPPAVQATTPTSSVTLPDLPVSERASSIIAIIFASAFAFLVAAFGAALAYRVFQDGNSTLTADIIHGVLSDLVPLSLVMAMVIVGRSGAQALILKLLGGLAGGAGGSGTGGN